MERTLRWTAVLARLPALENFSRRKPRHDPSHSKQAPGVWSPASQEQDQTVDETSHEHPVAADHALRRLHVCRPTQSYAIFLVSALRTCRPLKRLDDSRNFELVSCSEKVADACHWRLSIKRTFNPCSSRKRRMHVLLIKPYISCLILVILFFLYVELSKE